MRPPSWAGNAGGRWRRGTGSGLIEATLQAAIDAGSIPRSPRAPLAHLLMGALDEAAMFVARADDRVAARAEMGAALWTPARRLRGELRDGLTRR